MGDFIEVTGGIIVFGAILIYALIMFDMVHETANATKSIADCYINNVCEYKELGSE